MAYNPVYSEETITREDLNKLPGPTLVEFGANWCPICSALAPELEALLNDYPQVRHLKVEDGRGKPLGRSFRVKLWPTLVFLRDGEVLRQVARPDPAVARDGLAAITAEK